MYPFSLKLLWSPIIDGLHIPKIGPRKTWVILAQSTVALVLASIGFLFDDLVDAKNIVAITALYFLLIFMVTVQDISVDGWALTLLSDDVLGAAANMQTMGQLIGSFSWNIYFSLVIDKTTYPIYIKYWSIVYLISTVLVLVFVKEKVLDGVKNSFSNLLVCFKNLFRLFTLRSIRWWILVCLTCKIAFAPHGEALMLKLRDRCVEKKLFSSISMIMKPISLAINFFLIKFTMKRPLGTLLYGYPLYQVCSCASALLVWKAEELVANDTIFYYILFYDIVKSCTASAFYLSASGFHYTIADPLMGGVYMTLLNSLFNMGGSWVETSSLKFLGIFDDQIEKNKTHCEKYKQEDFVDDGIYQYSGWDSYFYLAIIAFSVGTIWYAIFFKIIKKIEKFPIDDWRLPENRKGEKITDEEGADLYSTAKDSEKQEKINYIQKKKK